MLMNRFGLLLLLLSALFLFPKQTSNARAADTGSSYYVASVIPYTSPLKPLVSWDIAWLDSNTETYVLADRTNSGLDVVDARTNTFVRNIGGFIGVQPTGAAGGSGPNGVVVVPNP